ncbi:unnamed protein product [Lactuca saligna]|uniref:PP4R3 EVH1-like domain-containing protein n=1 Tax=Lactuca saligna TaxID=75948 RepID=A0AA35ZY39_LACSI|nr:unnamed protein product [Lactuca saligna]
MEKYIYTISMNEFASNYTPLNPDGFDAIKCKKIARHLYPHFLQQRSEELGLFVVDEEDNETLLMHRICSDDIYRKQEDTIHSWRDSEFSSEITLSFQETTWCSYIWYQFIPQTGGAFIANTKIRMVASWEPIVLATIIIPSVFVARESSTTLGLGFRCGFLG